jgi:TRAP transporter TAXI family solute receptor
VREVRKTLGFLSALIVVLLLGYRFFTGNELPAKIRIATGGEAGVYNVYGSALAEILEKRMNIPVVTIPSGGSVDNIHLLRNNRAEIAFVQNDIMTYAYEGTNLFSTDGVFKDFSAVAGLYPEICQIVAKSEISGISELKGRRVSVGAEGSGTELNALQILGAYGLSYTDVDIDHLSFGASVAALKEGKIDAFFCTAGVPTPAISELTSGGQVRLLNVGDAHARNLISQYPFYSRQKIPSGVYPGIDDETATVAVKAVLVASGKLSEYVVSELLKIIFEARGEIAKTRLGSDFLSPKSAVDGIPIPLHPEAEKYFFGN